MDSDLFLSPHAASLLGAIRRRALQLYLTPYTAVDLGTMARAFGMSADVLQGEIAELIGKGELNLRIDAERGVLLAHVADARGDALRATCAASRDFAANARQLLMRASMDLAGLQLGSAKHSLGGGGGGGGGAAAGAEADTDAPNSGESGDDDALMAAATAASIDLSCATHAAAAAAGDAPA